MAEDLERETTELLQRLVRFNTVNPPGNERPAQDLLAGLLRDAVFEVALLGRLGLCLALTGQRKAAERTWSAAAKRARDARRPDLLARAALATTLGPRQVTLW